MSTDEIQRSDEELDRDIEYYLRTFEVSVESDEEDGRVTSQWLEWMVARGYHTPGRVQPSGSVEYTVTKLGGRFNQRFREREGLTEQDKEDRRDRRN